MLERFSWLADCLPCNVKSLSEETTVEEEVV